MPGRGEEPVQKREHTSEEDEIGAFQRQFLIAIGAPSFDKELTRLGLQYALDWEDASPGDLQIKVARIDRALTMLWNELDDSPAANELLRLAALPVGQKSEDFARDLHHHLTLLNNATLNVTRRKPSAAKGRPRIDHVRRDALSLTWLAFSIRR